MRNAGEPGIKLRQFVPPPQRPLTTCQERGGGRREKGEEKGKENPISNPAFDQTRTAKRITVQRVARESLSLSTGHVAVTYCLVFRDYWSGGTLAAAPRLSLSLRVFICVCPKHCEWNSCHNVKTFLLSSGFPAQIVTHIWRAKAKICSTFAFEFFLKFWTFVGSIQSSFLFSFQKYKFFWNRTKIDVFTMFFPWNYFLCARIPSFLENGKQNVKVLWEEFRCHLILWVTMWAEFFSHCDSHCEKIVRKLWVEMNTLNICFRSQISCFIELKSRYIDPFDNEPTNEPTNEFTKISKVTSN